MTFSYTIETSCIIAFKYFVLFLFPFSELIRIIQAQSTLNSEIATKLESFERNVETLLSNGINSKNNEINNNNNNNNSNSNKKTGTDSTNTESNASSSGTSDDDTSTSTKTISPLSASVPVPPNNTPPSPSSQNSLIDDVKHLRMQSNEAALDLSDKIDDLNDKNQALKAQIVALESQLEEEQSKANKTHNMMANRVDILEGYLQSGARFESQRKQENQQIQILSQKNTDLINQRINTVEEQLMLSLTEFEDRRSKELQSLVDTFKSLRQHYDDIKIELDKQIQIIADQGKDLAVNSETIRGTFSSDVLANLGQGVRDAMDMCERKLVEMEADYKKMQAELGKTDENLNIAKDRVVEMNTELHDMRAGIMVNMTDQSGRLGWLLQQVAEIVDKLGFESDGFRHNQDDGNSPEETGDEVF
ncbi:hypothetical protein PS15p_206085 [Mucor circinelloides]